MQPYQAYLANEGTCADGGIDCLTSAVVDCLYDHTTPSFLVNQQSAAIVLGLLPTILGMAGSTTVEIGLLGLRRPLLAFLVALGNPCFNPLRVFDSRNIVNHLGLRSDHSIKRSAPLPLYPALLVSALQYSLVLGAVANVALIVYDLSIRTVNVISMSSTFLPGIWIATSVAVTLLGFVALLLRVQLQPATTGAESQEKRGSKPYKEFEINSNKTRSRIILRQETYIAIAMTWLVDTLVIAHLAYGTYMLSSSLFVYTLDAGLIALRLFASSLACRGVLMYELSGMRENVAYQVPVSEE